MLLFQLNKTVKKEESVEKIFNDHAMTLDQARNFILKKAADCKVLLFGETHLQRKKDTFICSLLSDLKKEGYNYYVVETPHIPSAESQQLFDKYMKGEINFKELEYKVEISTLGSGLLEECKRLGIRILCPDDRSNLQRNGVQNEKERFDSIRKLVPEGAKFIVHYGSAHTSYNHEWALHPIDRAAGLSLPTMGGLLREKYGDAAYSVFFTDAGFRNKPSDLNVWKKEGGIETKHFGDKQVKLYEKDSQKYLKDWDFIVHMRAVGTYTPSKTEFLK